MLTIDVFCHNIIGCGHVNYCTVVQKAFFDIVKEFVEDSHKNEKVSFIDFPYLKEKYILISSKEPINDILEIIFGDKKEEFEEYCLLAYGVCFNMHMFY